MRDALIRRFMTVLPGILLAAAGVAHAQTPPATLRQSVRSAPSDPLEFGHWLEDAFAAKDSARLQLAFDMESFMVRVFKDSAVPGNIMDSFSRGLTESHPAGLLGQIGDSGVLHFVAAEGRSPVRAMFRITPRSGGVSWIEFELRPVRDGSLAVVDFFNFTLGISGSDVIKGLALPALRKLAGGNDRGVDDTRRFAEAVESVHSEDWAGGYERLGRLPGSMAASPVVPMLRLTCAVHLQDERKVRKSVKEAEKAGADPTAIQFLLVDWQISNSRFSEAVETISAISSKYPQDGYLRFLLGNVENMQDRRSAAIAEYRAAIALEPDLSDAYFALAARLHESGASPEAVRLLEKLQASGQDMEDAITAVEELSPGFAATPDAQAWLEPAPESAPKMESP